MKTAGVLALTILLCACSLSASTSIPRYHTEYDFLMASPASMGFGLYGYANPALLRQVEQADLLFGWRGTSDDFSDFDRWGPAKGRHTIA